MWFAAALAEAGVEPSNPFDAFIQPVIDVLRFWGAWGIALSIVIVVWWQWPKIKELPGATQLVNGLQRIIALVTRKSLPRAREDRFSVVVTHLLDDDRHDVEAVVAAGLSDFSGVELLRVDREIRDDDVAASHEHARDLLRKIQADAIIWGRLLKYPGKTSVPRLYWTVNHDVAVKKAAENYLPTEDLKLPELFWNDLKDVLELLVVRGAADFEALEGHYTANRLRPFIEKVEGLLTRADWASENRAPMQFILAFALQSLGEQSRNNIEFVRSIDAYTEVLQEYTRERVPLQWAMTQNNLGNALMRLGERENDPGRLLAAVAAYTEALQERARERVPLQWAMTQNNLGGVLMRLGERENDSGRLLAAVAAYTEALQEYTRERVPLRWAATQNNLGGVLMRLGERENDSGRLLAAAAAYTEALQEYTRERVPLDWATTQNNLGNALVSLGERENDSGRLLAAVAAYTEALQERARERVPLQWAMTQNNLGGVLVMLGERENDSGRLLAAVAAYTEALQEYTCERAPYQWDIVRNNLAAVHQVLEERWYRQDGA
jgi:tetratricopeptide (TPR) repeat protein